MDVVFVHGIRGGAFATWRRKGVINTDPEHTEGNLDHPYCWPAEWLAKDVPQARLLSMEYAAPASGWEVCAAYKSMCIIPAAFVDCSCTVYIAVDVCATICLSSCDMVYCLDTM